MWFNNNDDDDGDDDDDNNNIIRKRVVRKQRKQTQTAADRAKSKKAGCVFNFYTDYTWHVVQYECSTRYLRVTYQVQVRTVRYITYVVSSGTNLCTLVRM